MFYDAIWSYVTLLWLTSNIVGYSILDFVKNIETIFFFLSEAEAEAEALCFCFSFWSKRVCASVEMTRTHRAAEEKSKIFEDQIPLDAWQLFIHLNIPSAI